MLVQLDVAGCAEAVDGGSVEVVAVVVVVGFGVGCTVVAVPELTGRVEGGRFGCS